MASELLSLLCTFENSTKCCKISFDYNSFQVYYRNSCTFDLDSLGSKVFKIVVFLLCASGSV